MLVNYFGPRPTALSSDAFSNGQTGLQSAQEQVNQASTALAQQPLSGRQSTDASGLQVSSVTRELINLAEGELVFKANARSIEAASSMFDSLLAVGSEQGAAPRAEEVR